MGKPQRTVRRWLSKMAKPMAKNVAKHNSIATFPLKPLATLNITLYPCQYEKTENIIRDKSINHIFDCNLHMNFCQIVIGSKKRISGVSALSLRFILGCTPVVRQALP